MKKLIFLSSLVLSTYIIQAQPLDTPSVTCAETTTNSLAFDWNDIENAVGYEASVELNGNVLFDTILTTSYLTVFDLFPGTEVTVKVIAIANIPSNNSSPTSSICVTADCPQNPITINNIGSEYCQYDAPIELSASPVGTVFTGDGVIDNVFYPNLVEGSESVLQAEYNDTFGCFYITNMNVTLAAPLEAPIVYCNTTTTNSVGFMWDAVEGANTYEVAVSINGAFSSLETTTNTSYQEVGLTVNDEVTIEVMGVSTGVCGNSNFSTVTCIASDCPAVTLTIDNLAAEYCTNEAPVVLVGTPAGGAFSGEGILNESIFDPSLVTNSETIISYSYVDPTTGCAYTTSTAALLAVSLATPIVNCTEATENSAGFAWEAVEGAIEYEVTVSINGTSFAPVTTTNTNYQEAGLTVNDEVTIEVTAVSTGICGNSEIGSSTCLPVGINDLTQKPTVHISTLINQQQPFLINGKDILSTTLTIYDLQGRAIYQKNGQTTYPLNLPNGLYIYELKLNDQQETSESIRGKFIVQ